MLEGVEAWLKVFDQPRVRTARETLGTAAGAALPQVFVDTKVVRVRPSDVERLCLGTEPGVVPLDRAVALLKKWESEKAVDDSFTALLALSGQDAEMFIGEVLEVDGEHIELGKHLAVTPVVVPQRDAIALNFTATWRRLKNEPEGARPAGWQPDIEERTVTANAEVTNGAWLLLRSKDRAEDVILVLANFRLVRR